MEMSKDLSVTPSHKAVYDISIGDTLVTYVYDTNNGSVNRDINVYELGNECKKWAYKTGYCIESAYATSHIKTECSEYLDEDIYKSERNAFSRVNKTNDYSRKAIFFIEKNTEIETIFKACEFILKEDNK